MNERIRELALQAEEYALSVCDNNGHFHRIYREKFAELIQQECMAVSEDVANADGNGPWFEGYISGVEELNRRIKQHFGVEE
jgi:hypothetical protein